MDRAALVKTGDEAFRKYLDKLGKVNLKTRSGDYQILTRDRAREVYRLLVENAATHLRGVKFRSVTVPASGGADSTFMLKILRDASDKIVNEGGPKVEIIGLTLPCKLQSDAEYYDDMGRWACELYADDYATINILPAHEMILDSLLNLDAIQMQKSGKTARSVFDRVSPKYAEREYKVDRGNAAARLRMITAYGLSKMFSGAPCSTDNLSEKLTGFWTLCGDEGTFKYIQNIWKGLEQPLIMHAAEIPTPFYTQTPTDGLGVGDGDVHQMYGRLHTGKEDYIDVDIVLINFMDGNPYPDPINPTVPSHEHPVCRLKVNTEFKRTPFSLSRVDLDLHAFPY